MKKVYFVLYGAFDYKYVEQTKASKKIDPVVFGERCGLGWTVGEEVIFGAPQPPAKVVRRMESVYAV